VGISKDDFCVNPVTEAVKTALIIGMSTVASVAAVLLSLGIIVYRLRVRLYTRWKFHPFDRDECPGEDMDYDVFLCCSSLDDEPVGSRILDSVEANDYRVCYHERDFMPGLIADNIEASVTRTSSHQQLHSKVCESLFGIIVHIIRSLSILNSYPIGFTISNDMRQQES